MPYNFPQYVANMQLNAGYKADEWGIATFGQLLNMENNPRLAQSLVNGRWSIHSFDKSISEVSVKDLEQFGEFYDQGKVAPGMSTFFTSLNSFSDNLIHDRYIKHGGRHYHNLTQVTPRRNKETGEVIYPLRQTLGLFSIPYYLADIPVAVSEVKANDKLAFQLDNGYIIQCDVGEGKIMQIVVTKEVLALLHQHPTHVIYQQDKKHGVEKARVEVSGQSIEWNFKGHETNMDEKFIVDPAGIAKPTPR